MTCNNNNNNNNFCGINIGHNWSSRKFPIYDDRADYNTNSPSYYDYLARMMNFMLSEIETYLNQVLRRNIIVTDTNSIDFVKVGDWINNGQCPPNHFDDIIEMMANVKISSEKLIVTLNNLTTKTYTLDNSISIKEDGIFSPDYLDIIRGIDNEIGKIYQKIVELETYLNEQLEKIYNLINNQGNALQKIINNLYESGAITNNDINNFTFVTGTNIAHGNINHYINNENSGLYIKTKKTNENTTVIGYE